MFLVLVVAPLVLVLLGLIWRINHVEHFAPQAYYRQKTGGAPVAFGYESLGPRLRRPPPSADGVVPHGDDAVTTSELRWQSSRATSALGSPPGAGARRRRRAAVQEPRRSGRV